MAADVDVDLVLHEAMDMALDLAMDMAMAMDMGMHVIWIWLRPRKGL